MNKIYLKLIFPKKNNKTIEVIFDLRLCFIDNFKLLKAIIPDLDTDNFYIYDTNMNFFLDKKCPLKNFNLDNLYTLTVF